MLCSGSRLALGTRPGSGISGGHAGCTRNTYPEPRAAVAEAHVPSCRGFRVDCNQSRIGNVLKDWTKSSANGADREGRAVGA